MSGHDPLCPMREPDPGDTVRQSDCQCYLIAKVRADERERIAQAIEADEWIVGRIIAARTARNGGRDE